MTELIEIICKECPALFLPGRKTQVFCSRQCKQNWSSRDWRRRNPEGSKAHDRKNRERHGDAINARVKVWRERNQAYTKAKDAERWPARRDVQNPRRAQWAIDNPERTKEMGQNGYRRARETSPWSLLVNGARNRAKSKGIKFDLTDEWARSVWTGRCALSGIPFDTIQGKLGLRTFSPSLDRIRPKDGYTVDNCRFILWAVNAFKGTGTDEEVIRIAKAIYEMNPFVTI